MFRWMIERGRTGLIAREDAPQAQAVFRGLAPDMIIKKNCSGPGAGHKRFGENGCGFPKFGFAVVVVELFLHVTRAPALAVAAVETKIHQVWIGDHVQSGKQLWQGRAVHGVLSTSWVRVRVNLRLNMKSAGTWAAIRSRDAGLGIWYQV